MGVIAFLITAAVKVLKDNSGRGDASYDNVTATYIYDKPGECHFGVAAHDQFETLLSTQQTGKSSPYSKTGRGGLSQSRAVLAMAECLAALTKPF